MTDTAVAIASDHSDHKTRNAQFVTSDTAVRGDEVRRGVSGQDAGGSVSGQAEQADQR